MSRRGRSSMDYAEKQKIIEGSSQLEIDRTDHRSIEPIKPRKRKKPSRRGSRGRGLNKQANSSSEPSNAEISLNKNLTNKSHHRANETEDRVPHFADRIEFIIALKYDNGKFINMKGNSTTIFREAVRNCGPDYSVYTSDGIKVYPIPAQWLGIDKYTIQNLDTHETETLKYSELNEAIKHCRIGYGVFDPQNDRVY